MPDPFFVIPKAKGKKTQVIDPRPKRKHPEAHKHSNSKKPAAATVNRSDKSGKKNDSLSKNTFSLEEDISGSDSGESSKTDSEGESDSSVKESAEEKRLRLAKQYIQSLRDGLPEDELEVDAREIDRDIIAERLQKDAVWNAEELSYVETLWVVC
ncbi:pre-rRNA processing protein [Massospora cicadina]|nr:pre-rRNA processing protein [Massospora cicadina]